MPTSNRTIRVGAIDVTVRTSNRATLDVTVTKHGHIVVRGPHTTTDTDATALVERRRTWIYRRLTHLAETLPDNPLKHLTTGEEFTALGQPYALRTTPDTGQQQPLTAVRDAQTGDWLHLRRSTALKPDESRRAIINFYAKTGREWLKNNQPHIRPNTPNQDLYVTFSTRMRTTWTRHHNNQLTLHWATAQLAPPLLNELIHRTLNLHTIANNHDLNSTLQNLWLGRLTTTPHTHFKPTGHSLCPDCATPPGTLHADQCDIARCALTGLQRAHCHPGNTCNTVWTGQLPGEAECTEYGYYCRPTPSGYEPCNADDPDAIHDLNRLYRECRWDPAAQRMRLPSRSTPKSPQPPNGKEGNSL